MGYTHYWDSAVIAEGAHDTVKAAVDKIIRASNVPIGDAAGVQLTPEFNTDYIAFNGMNEGAHETFIVTFDNAEWSFCKTAYKPYDIVVTACLSYLATYYGYRVSSDGDHDDWEAGVKLAERALNMPVANPLVAERILG